MIRFDCVECGKALTVKDEAAGRKGVCKFCRASIRVPEGEDVAGEEVAAPDSFVVWFQRAGASVAAVCGAGWRSAAGAVSAWRERRREARSQPPALPAVRAEFVPAVQGELIPVGAGELAETVPCPFCDEPIRKAAKKCRHCGEILDPGLRSGMAPAVGAGGPTVVHVTHAAPERYRRWNRGVAIVLSFFIPGLGQMYKGQVFNGLLWLGLTLVGYACFILPGLALHLLCLIGAGMGDETR